MDNATYHHCYPDDAFFPKTAKKKDVQNWLTKKGIIYEEKLKRPELIDLAMKNWIPPRNLLLKDLASEEGLRKFRRPHQILYLPPYHPELNPIELAWWL